MSVGSVVATTLHRWGSIPSQPRPEDSEKRTWTFEFAAGSVANVGDQVQVDVEGRSVENSPVTIHVVGVPSSDTILHCGGYMSLPSGFALRGGVIDCHLECRTAEGPTRCLFSQFDVVATALPDVWLSTKNVTLGPTGDTIHFTIQVPVSGFTASISLISEIKETHEATVGSGVIFTLTDEDVPMWLQGPALETAFATSIVLKGRVSEAAKAYVGCWDPDASCH